MTAAIILSVLMLLAPETNQETLEQATFAIQDASSNDTEQVVLLANADFTSENPWNTPGCHATGTEGQRLHAYARCAVVSWRR